MNVRFKKLLWDHRQAFRVPKSGPGIIEVRGERKILLNDIMQALDYM